MSKDHYWSYPVPGEARHCIRSGCTVRVSDGFRYWQPKPRGHWRNQSVDLIPDCQGGNLSSRKEGKQ